MAISVGGLFWWGSHFHLFGTDIDWSGQPVEYVGFFAWMVIGAYGAGYAYGGRRRGIQTAGGLFITFVFAAAIGAVRRNIG
jgi:hypothetical protein